MVLCDVGNTFLHFFYKGEIRKEKLDALKPKKPEVCIYYISVNKKAEKKLLASHRNCINLAPYFEINTGYSGIGIDRIAACAGIESGIVVDAGSAITIDIVQDNVHLGGYILPGLQAYRDSYKSISNALDYDIDLSTKLDALPLNTRAAISFGCIKSIILMIGDSARGKKITFTGGDGKFFSRFFENSIFDEAVVFKGMQKAYENFIKQKDSCNDNNRFA